MSVDVEDAISSPPGSGEPPDDLWIRVHGARTHNLKDIDVRLPRDQFVVITGVSGSGKSSLAFDSLYAEGQRRYIESLSSYARQFLEQMPRPDCDRITGLPPTVAIEQQPEGGGPNSTVATTTEIYDFLRLLFARVGTPHCPRCGAEIEHQTLEQIVGFLSNLPDGTRLTLLAPVVHGRKGHYRELFERIRSEGYVRARIDGNIRDLDEVDRLQRYKTHDIDVVVDRVVISGKSQTGASARLSDSVQTALNLGEGVCVALKEDGDEFLFNRKFACTECDLGIEEPNPKMFSFNSPYGRCEECKGRGTVDHFDADLIVPNPSLSIDDGAIEPLEKWGGRAGKSLKKDVMDLVAELNVNTATAFEKLPEKDRRALIEGEELPEEAAEKQAVIPALRRLRNSTDSSRTRRKLARYISPVPCPACEGARLRPAALAVKIDRKNIHDVTRMAISETVEFFDSVSFPGTKTRIAEPILKEIRERLGFLLDVGLHYLTLERLTNSLSTGESQRTRLATQIGSGLTGVCYILDEPSIGLHPRDHERLLGALENLCQAGNTVLVVEHDEETIRRADWVLDLGPGAGSQGGDIVFNGPFADMLECESSLTARYLKGEKSIPVPERRRDPEDRSKLVVREASEHNLKQIDVAFPLGRFICVTGVSGSGKSTLVNEILVRSLAREINNSPDVPGRHKTIEGIEHIDKVLEIDQKPVGRTPRSCPATYTKVFDHIRKVFAGTKQSQVRGYDRGRFSFNTSGGRCEVCNGMGQKKVEMNLLPDMRVECESCHGRRYNEETLQITVRGRNIADVLEMTVEEAFDFFLNYPPIERRLRTMRDVGIGYLKLGQPSTTLSGGEAQRIKLARELGKVATGNTLYALDEPTTGLHFEDVGKLLNTLHSLADMGNTIIVIEHNLEVIKNADYVIDLGPEGGRGGGTVVTAGAPEEIRDCEDSYTGQALKRVL
ncbi:MAG: excinuclease ABC subunit UvrA [Planctomycetes bacterium]|nr:excinuclease ABC subunit UvrA [Planctomycetota bacterium]